jgi:hypothetical protein
MKIIDNKSLRLLNVLESSITSETSVYYSGSYFTSFSLFYLLPTFKKVKSIKFLLNFSEDSNPSVFINNESEEHLNLNLDKKFKIDSVKKFISQFVEIKSGSIGNQNLLILSSNEKTVYESYTDSIIQLKSSTLTGVFSKERRKRSKQDLEHLLKVESIQTELISLKSQLKKETQLKKRVSLNMEIQQRKQDIENIKHTLIQ